MSPTLNEESDPCAWIVHTREITNRWSSRLRGGPEPRVQSRNGPRPLVVVGGAAQLYVMRQKDLLLRARTHYAKVFEARRFA